LTTHLIDNIFSEEERLKIIEDVQPLLLDGIELGKYITHLYNPDYGAVYQEGFSWFSLTHDTVHQHPDFKERIEIITQRASEEVKIPLKCIKAWVNVSDGRSKRRMYHNHQAFFSSVYYIKTFPFFSNGTVFKDRGLVKAPQNSLLLFPSHFLHTTPGSPLRFKRYTMALDFIEA
tara:strand:- start:840 stop:1364 length:525 start_codon:yes stop_codon:yes gene_type:complete